MTIMSCSRALLFICCVAAAQTPPTPAPKAPPSEVAGIHVNYDEALTGTYTLPDPLTLANGMPVKDAQTWNQKRRPEIVRLFEENEYGRAPGRPAAMTFDVFDKGTPAFDGKGIRKQVTIYFSADKNGPKMDLLLYTSAKASAPSPVLLNASFSANSSTVADPGIKPGEVWGRDKKRAPAPPVRGRGVDVARLLDAGFGFATVYYGDIDPDFLGGVPLGVRALYLKPGQTEPAADEWGSIAAWAWGLSRALDYLETDKAVDAKRVAVTGVSRLGKTVMWAGAHDQRFAAVIASCSGEGGAALSRRNYGETIAHLTAPTRYPYQFCANYSKYAEHVDKLPVDANMLVALMAPRPLLLQTGDQDFWSDPKGEFLAAVAAGPVYNLLGAKALETDKFPAPGVFIGNILAYYMHAGGHGMVPSDWDQYLAFLKTHLAPPKFEVASIKVAAEGPNGVRGGCRGIDTVYSAEQEKRGGIPPLGRCTITDARLSHLIGIAYDVQMQVLETGADWIQRGDLRFDVQAKGENPETTTQKQLITMLQNLLVERFQIKFHYVTKDEPGFALEVAKNGPKLIPSTAEEEKLTFFGPAGQELGKPVGKAVKVIARKCSIATLKDLIAFAGDVGRGVDKTGLTGVYDFTLSWNEEEGPSLASALQKQLGLQLKSEKVPVSRFVLDSAQKPTPN